MSKTNFDLLQSLNGALNSKSSDTLRVDIVSGGGGGGGDSTAANQTLQLAQETAIAGSVDSLDGKVVSCDTGSIVGSVSITGTAAVSAVSLPLPSGAASEAKQDDLIEKITVGEGIITGGAGGLQQVLMYGKTASGGNNLQPIELTGDRLIVDVQELNVGFAQDSGGTMTQAGAVQIYGGYDSGGSNRQLRTLKCDDNGVLETSLASLPLPSGAASESTLSALNGKVTACDTGSISGSVSITGTTAVSAVSLPLPSGASSESTLSALNGKVVSCDTGNISGSVVEASASSILADTTIISGSHYIDGGSYGVNDTGVMMMGRNGANVARPIHITSNGDVEVEIADFVKGQALMAASFPVVISSDQSALEANTLRDPTSDVQTNVAIPQSGTFTSNTIDMNGHSKLSIMGSSTNTNDQLRIQYSVDDITYYRDNTNITVDFSSGNYASVVDTGGARYVQITQTDTQTTAFTMNFSSSKR